MNIGEQIRNYRKKAGISQKELGERLGVSQQHIAQYENGKRIPKVETINAIAAALDADPFSLYSFEMASEALEKNIDKKEGSLLDSYRQLNPAGQEKAIEHVELLTKVPEYRKEE